LSAAKKHARRANVAWEHEVQSAENKCNGIGNFGELLRNLFTGITACNARRKKIMLWTIFVILLILWLLGFVGFHVLGAYIHILLVIALVVLLIQLIGGRTRTI
jgi:uncharacterized membrane protein YtjA (UPF0391 family)